MASNEKKLLILLAAFIGLAFISQSIFPPPIFTKKETTYSPLEHPLEVSIQKPTQSKITHPKPFLFKQYNVTPVARYRIKATILGRYDYWFDEGSDLSPLDLALGWGIMSDPKMIKKVEISQGNRWYYWRAKDNFTPLDQIAHSSANTHIIPANDTIKNKIKKVQKGQIVDLEGYLVNITKQPNNWHWSSSLTREDTGNGACEVFFVNQIHAVSR